MRAYERFTLTSGGPERGPCNRERRSGKCSGTSPDGLMSVRASSELDLHRQSLDLNALFPIPKRVLGFAEVRQEVSELGSAVASQGGEVCDGVAAGGPVGSQAGGGIPLPHR